MSNEQPAWLDPEQTAESCAYCGGFGEIDATQFYRVTVAHYQRAPTGTGCLVDDMTVNVCAECARRRPIADLSDAPFCGG